MPFIRSISGLRATLGDSLYPDIITGYITAFSSYCSKGTIIIGRDGRPSGYWIEKIIVGTLLALGREVKVLGVVPTPTIQLMVEHSEAVGGIAITASHNPEQWNGMKFINANGVFLDAEENKKMWDFYDNCKIQYNYSSIIPEIHYDYMAVNKHIDNILKIPALKQHSILKSIRKKKYKVVIDAVNASGSIAIPQLLEELGCEIIPLFCDGSGIFPHIPEPLPQNLGLLSEKVKELHADLGIAVDPDADRLVLIDETGNPIGEEKTIVLSVLSILSSLENTDSKSVVVNYSTTRMVQDIAESYNTKLYRSPVGEINVVKKMKETNAVIGGEGSGGVILPDCHYGRDSLVGTALILSLMTKSNKKLSELSNELPKYEMLKYKKEFTGNINNIIDTIKKLFPDSIATCDDGIRIDFDDSWVQLRASNTEPIVRIISEAPTKKLAEELAKKVLNIIE